MDILGEKIITDLEDRSGLSLDPSLSLMEIMLYWCVTVTHHYNSFIALQESRDVEGGGDHRAADAPTPEAGPAVKLRGRSNPAGLQCPVGGLLQVTLIIIINIA